MDGLMVLRIGPLIFVLIYISYSGFFQGIFAQIPRKPRGDFKNPEGTLADPRAAAEAVAEARGPASVPEGFLKSPTGLRGIWRRYPQKKPE